MSALNQVNLQMIGKLSETVDSKHASKIKNNLVDSGSVMQEKCENYMGFAPVKTTYAHSDPAARILPPVLNSPAVD